MKRIIGLLLTGSVLFCSAQKKMDPVPFGNTILADNLKKDLLIVASPEFEGRETATEGQRKAAAYIEQYFRGLQLKPGNDSVYQLPFPVYQDSLLSTRFTVNDDSFSVFNDYDLSLANNYAAGLGTSEVAYAGYGVSDSAQDDYAGLDVRGKIVLVKTGYPEGYLRRHTTTARRFNGFAKSDEAQQHGAVAVLVIQHDFPHTRAPREGNMYREVYKPVNRPITVNISENLARTIMGSGFDSVFNNSLAPGRTYSCRLWFSFDKETRFMQSTDVLGYMEGTDLKDQLLVISAHYDHLGKKGSTIYYGADDDGSGTVSLLEIAAAFAKARAAGKGPRRSMLFLANSGEEKGL
ncbi:MAG TPA: M28 family peptidase, partial [Puia sp.]|nr:M28 family peptidase [Puia sp.]